MMNRYDIVNEIELRCQDIQNILKQYREILTAESTFSTHYIFAVEMLDKHAAEIRQHINGLRGYGFVNKKETKLSSEAVRPIDPEEVADKTTPFFQKRVVITGMIATFPEREQLAMLLRSYGADINTSISSKTDIVIVGQGAGPSKMRKIEELREKGIDIRVIEEPELLQILDAHTK